MRPEALWMMPLQQHLSIHIWCWFLKTTSKYNLDEQLAANAQSVFLPPRPACGERAGVRGLKLSRDLFQHNNGLLQYFIIPKSD